MLQCNKRGFSLLLYSLVEMNRAAMAPIRLAAKAGYTAMHMPGNPLKQTELGKSLIAATDVLERATRFYGKPEWQIETTEVNGHTIDVITEAAWVSPWCKLLHFRKDDGQLSRARKGKRRRQPQPKLLIVAPLSGHYATLLRGTVEGFLPDHDVYITDWTDARMAPLWFGRFDLDDYIDHIQDMLAHIGGGAHVLSVCQPGPPVLAAIAMMAEDDDPALPASMIYMGSPMDARRSPTVPNLLASEKPFEWFETHMIYTVPAPWPGMMRRVYPGFVQLSSFMNMNRQRHIDAQWQFFDHLVAGDGDSAEKHREFYDEYLSVLDLTEEFYLQTITKVFQEHHLARGVFRYRDDHPVRPDAITSVALMTVEGEKDDISGIGQTQAAHDLCSNIPDAMKADHVQAGAGHYGVFNGRRFRDEIVPRVTEFVTQFDK